MNMNNMFIEMAKNAVVDYFNSNADSTDKNGKRSAELCPKNA